MDMNNDDTLVLDELMPNSGEEYHFEEDEGLTDHEKEEQRAERDEQSMMRSAGPALVEQLLTWFDNEINATDSVRAVKAHADSIGKDEAVVLEAFDILRGLLEEQKQRLIDLRDTHL